MFEKWDKGNLVIRGGTDGQADTPQDNLQNQQAFFLDRKSKPHESQQENDR